MFCPRCGSPLEVRDDVLICISTGSDFSNAVQRELNAIADSPPSEAAPLKIRYGSAWHCPADGTQIIEEAGRAACSLCGRSLPGSLLYGLIEFHHHPRLPSGESARPLLHPGQPPTLDDEPTRGGSRTALIVASLVLFGLLAAFVALLVTLDVVGLGHIDG